MRSNGAIFAFCVQSLTCAVHQLEAQLEVEQEKLATLARNLSMDVSQQKQEREESVSEEWLQSLKERRKVGGNLPIQ